MRQRGASTVGAVLLAAAAGMVTAAALADWMVVDVQTRGEDGLDDAVQGQLPAQLADADLTAAGTDEVAHRRVGIGEAELDAGRRQLLVQRGEHQPGGHVHGRRGGEVENHSAHRLRGGLEVPPNRIAHVIRVEVEKRRLDPEQVRQQLHHHAGACL